MSSFFSFWVSVLFSSFSNTSLQSRMFDHGPSLCFLKKLSSTFLYVVAERLLVYMVPLSPPAYSMVDLV